MKAVFSPVKTYERQILKLLHMEGSVCQGCIMNVCKLFCCNKYTFFLPHHQKTIENNTEEVDVDVPEDAVDDIEDIPFQDHDTRDSVSMSSATFVDQAVQVGEFPAQPYQCYEARKKPYSN